LSYSTTTNFLEGVNLAVRHLNIDQSTKHVGQQIMVVSAGSGCYKVCPDIAIPTRRRILTGGVSVRIVSLHKPPEKLTSKDYSAVFIYKCFSSDHKLHAKYDPFSTKSDRKDNETIYNEVKNDDEDNKAYPKSTF
jgi:hypothetical protein